MDRVRIDFIPLRGGWYGACPCTADGCTATITTRYGTAMSWANVLNLGHFPMTAVIAYEET